MSLIIDNIKIKYSREGYLPNYPHHLISDKEMIDAFINNDICYFDDYYQLRDESLREEYENLKKALKYHTEQYLKKDTPDWKEMPDWVYSYMLGVVIGTQSRKIDIHDLIVKLNTDNMDDDFNDICQKECFKISTQYVNKLPYDQKYSTIRVKVDPSEVVLPDPENGDEVVEANLNYTDRKIEAFEENDKIKFTLIPDGPDAKIVGLEYSGINSYFDVIIPDKVPEVGSYNGSDDLSGKAIVSIGDNTFSSTGGNSRYTNKIKYVRLGKYVKTIGKSAFESCRNLITVDLPENLQEIQENAFKNCSGIRNMIFRSTTSGFLQLGENCFSGIGLKENPINLYVLESVRNIRNLAVIGKESNYGGYFKYIGEPDPIIDERKIEVATYDFKITNVFREELDNIRFVSYDQPFRENWLNVDGTFHSEPAGYEVEFNNLPVGGSISYKDKDAEVGTFPSIIDVFWKDKKLVALHLDNSKRIEYCSLIEDEKDEEKPEVEYLDYGDIIQLTNIEYNNEKTVQSFSLINISGKMLDEVELRNTFCISTGFINTHESAELGKNSSGNLVINSWTENGRIDFQANGAYTIDTKFEVYVDKRIACAFSCISGLIFYYVYPLLDDTTIPLKCGDSIINVDRLEATEVDDNQCKDIEFRIRNISDKDIKKVYLRSEVVPQLGTFESKGTADVDRLDEYIEITDWKPRGSIHYYNRSEVLNPRFYFWIDENEIVEINCLTRVVAFYSYIDPSYNKPEIFDPDVDENGDRWKDVELFTRPPSMFGEPHVIKVLRVRSGLSNEVPEDLSE